MTLCMATSTPNPLPLVCVITHYLEPKKILEIGPGFGKYGHVFREYGDVNKNLYGENACKKEHFAVKIDAVEVFPQYLTPMHDFLYDKIIVGDALEVVPKIPPNSYDMVFMGDVIEHIEKPAAQSLVARLLEIAKHTLIVTPRSFFSQDALHGNDKEHHVSHWTWKDFGPTLVDCQGAGPSMIYLLSKQDSGRIPGFGNSLPQRLKRLGKFLLYEW